MNNYTENDAFEFGIKEANDSLLGNISKNNYENENLFNTEVYSNGIGNFSLENEEIKTDSNNINNDVGVKDSTTSSITESNQFDFGVFDTNFSSENNVNIENANPFITLDSKDIVEEVRHDIVSDANTELHEDTTLNDEKIILNSNSVVNNNVEHVSNDVTMLDEKDNSFDKKTEQLTSEINSSESKIQMSEEDLTSLTTFEEDKVETTDIKSLFDRVGINVKEASDVFKRNTEMKEKIDSRFEELKKLQLEVARKKEEQYAEINSYKEEVLDKLTEKKEEIERRLNKLKEYQTALEKEKEEFEQYRKKEKEEIERVQKEVQEAYDNRREELNHIEDVLRHQKDLLDEERSQLNLDKIQYESDKNELANNLLKFNEIVDSFTNGIEKIDKE